MEQINFRTTHNLVLSYPKAEIIQRITATLIDLASVLFLWIILNSFLPFLQVITSFVFLFMIFFYNLFFEIFNMGQTPGKKLLRIRVVNLDSNTPTLKAYILRWAFRALDIGLSFGTMAILSIYSSDKGQRLGDLIASTTVVQTKISSSNFLDVIQNLGNNNKEPKFANLEQYTDNEMLMVKKMINRYKLNQTFENGEMIRKLTEKFIAELEINPKHYKSYILLLQDVLEEYILSTR